MAQRLEGNLHIDGTLTAKVNRPSNGTVTNDSVASGANIDGSKLMHRNHVTYGQANSTAADEVKVIYVARAAGSVLSFRAGSIAKATGNATVEIDLKKNGVSVLQDPIVLDSDNDDAVPEAGNVTTDDYIAGDVFTVEIDGEAGTGGLPTGVFVDFEVEEAPAA